MQDIKGNSSKWINENKFIAGKFQWQESYGAFSYNRSALPKLIEYVKNQKIHHQKKTFSQEYKEFLICSRWSMMKNIFSRKSDSLLMQVTFRPYGTYSALFI